MYYHYNRTRTTVVRWGVLVAHWQRLNYGHTFHLIHTFLSTLLPLLLENHLVYLFLFFINLSWCDQRWDVNEVMITTTYYTPCTWIVASWSWHVAGSLCALINHNGWGIELDPLRFVDLASTIVERWLSTAWWCINMAYLSSDFGFDLEG